MQTFVSEMADHFVCKLLACSAAEVNSCKNIGLFARKLLILISCLSSLHSGTALHKGRIIDIIYIYIYIYIVGFCCHPNRMLVPRKEY
jgi:hypothetical protein